MSGPRSPAGRGTARGARESPRTWGDTHRQRLGPALRLPLYGDIRRLPGRSSPTPPRSSVGRRGVASKFPIGPEVASSRQGCEEAARTRPQTYYTVKRIGIISSLLEEELRRA